LVLIYRAIGDVITYVMEELNLHTVMEDKMATMEENSTGNYIKGVHNPI